MEPQRILTARAIRGARWIARGSFDEATEGALIALAAHLGDVHPVELLRAVTRERLTLAAYQAAKA